MSPCVVGLVLLRATPKGGGNLTGLRLSYRIMHVLLSSVGFFCAEPRFAPAGMIRLRWAEYERSA